MHASYLHVAWFVQVLWCVAAAFVLWLNVDISRAIAIHELVASYVQLYIGT